MGIISVLIEGGRFTLQAFIDANLWDEARVIVSKKKIENGTMAPTMKETAKDVESIFTDTIHTYRNK